MAKPDPDVTQTDILLQIAQTLRAVQEGAQGGANVTATLDKITETLAGVANRSRPENPESNGISAYSHPEGDYKHPKTPLKCDMFWVGYPLTVETLTPPEIDALNALKPGTFYVTKGNGNRIPFTVDGKFKQGGELESLWIAFPCKGDQMTDHRSMIEYCKEAMGEKLPTLRELQAEVARLRTELRAAQDVIEAV